ncbi:MAG: acetyl/propionyl/methylcrotonyl-CoA carboxylase subunit alpha [Nocardioides sp.]
MFTTVLIANRGEIAVRVIRTVRAMGLRSVAVYSDADAGARYVSEADLAVRIGPASALKSYLSIQAILDAARTCGAEAVHPGYGFLSENAEFAEACGAVGLILIGPPAQAMRIMGDKITAKQAALNAGVPVVPGRFDADMTDADLAAAATEVGYPVLIKPVAGGGGKGMRLVSDSDKLSAAVASARRESAASFGDDALFLERYVPRPRHIEVQILADTHGSVIHLGERECSLQRRHQKVIEEAPSILLDERMRSAMGSAAISLAQAVDYVGAGTVEFIVSADRPGEFFFLEMNTRLQVEHPVTELVAGLDLVAEQIRVAAGERLTMSQDDVRLTGHAVEARVYAEDPAGGFLPTGGRVLHLREPVAANVRVDSGIGVGTVVGTSYDPLLAKVIAWSPERSAALGTLAQALADTVILGVRTNLEFLQVMLSDPEVVAGRLDTELIERVLPQLTEGLRTDGPAGIGPANGLPAGSGPVLAETWAAYALVRLLELQPVGPIVDPWDVPSGWRPGEARPLVLRPEVVQTTRPATGVRTRAGAAHVSVWGVPEHAVVRIGHGPKVVARVVARRPAGGQPVGSGTVAISVGGVTRPWTYALDAHRMWLHRNGMTWELREAPRLLREIDRREAVGDVRSPMPGVVLDICVSIGDEVRAGQKLLVIEAMKMEHTVAADVAGVVSRLLVSAGDRVTLAQPLGTISLATPDGCGVSTRLTTVDDLPAN